MTGRTRLMAISDATGETAEQCCRAALAQFGTFPEGTVRVVPHVLDEVVLERVILEAKRENALLVYTLVGPEVRSLVQPLAQKHGVVAHDMLGGLVSRLASHLGRGAKNIPGLGHEMDEDYFRRIEAIEFAVYNDDGKSPSNLHKADIVVVGISRTSKTPLCNTIAHRGYKVANVPLVLDIPPPVELNDVDPRRVFALSIDPVTLMNIRRTRVETLGMASETTYADLRQIRRELTWAQGLFARHPGWTVMDVTRKAVEETAILILEAYRTRFETDAPPRKKPKKAPGRAVRKSAQKARPGAKSTQPATRTAATAARAKAAAPRKQARSPAKRASARGKPTR